MEWLAQRWKSRSNKFTSFMLILFSAVQANMQFIQPVFGDAVYYAIALIWGIGGYVMREITTKPVTEK